ncbi:MAG TPA: hypothetical protein VGK73_20530 [Polyangiaceae bacterium]
MRSISLPLCTALLALVSSAGCSSDDGEPQPSSDAGTAGSGTSGSAGSGGSSAGSGGSSAGSGGSAAGAGGSSAGSAGSGATDSPSDTTAEGIAAFLAAGSYKGSDWVSDVDAPRASDGNSHGMVRVWFNRTVRQSKADGDSPVDAGSMVVKELYGTGSSVVGHAVLLRSGQTIYYCESNEAGLCYSGHQAGMGIYGTSATGTNCACHGNGTIITPVPPP